MTQTRRALPVPSLGELRIDVIGAKAFVGHDHAQCPRGGRPLELIFPDSGRMKDEVS